MARRLHEDALGVAGAETIIGTGVKVHGNLTSQSDITIDGNLEGSISAEGSVTIGVNAQIKANITATSVVVAGLVNGNITTEGEASILETGHVEGDIKAGGLAIATGGIFVGRSLMDAPPRLNTEPESRPNHESSRDNHSRES